MELKEQASCTKTLKDVAEPKVLVILHTDRANLKLVHKWKKKEIKNKTNFCLCGHFSCQKGDTVFSGIETSLLFMRSTCIKNQLSKVR